MRGKEQLPLYARLYLKICTLPFCLQYTGHQHHQSLGVRLHRLHPRLGKGIARSLALQALSRDDDIGLEAQKKLDNLQPPAFAQILMGLAKISWRTSLISSKSISIRAK